MNKSNNDFPTLFAGLMLGVILTLSVVHIRAFDLKDRVRLENKIAAQQKSLEFYSNSIVMKDQIIELKQDIIQRSLKNK